MRRVVYFGGIISLIFRNFFYKTCVYEIKSIKYSFQIRPSVERTFLTCHDQATINRLDLILATVIEE